VVLLHGGVNSARHMMTLGLGLADAFTLVLPDRRGRGMSGSIGPGYCIEREDEDLAAVVKETGAQFVFGPADGGLFALHGAIGMDRISKVAAFEPLLFAGQPGVEEIRRAFTAMPEQIRAGRIGQAVMFSIHETVLDAARRGQVPTWLAAIVHRIPVRPTGAALDLLLRLESSRRGNLSLRDLLIALVPELDLVMATEGTLEQYRDLTAEVLLMHGSVSDPIFAASAEALHGVLPRSTVVRLPGLNHDSSQSYGKPDAIAAALRVFFSS
jgi:pimeloyl-ACP methyl ester carboxylesterase